MTWPIGEFKLQATDDVGERWEVDLKQEIHQNLTGRNTPQRFSRFGVTCYHCVAGKMPDLPYELRSSHRDRLADGLLLHESQDGQRADGGAQLPGPRVRMCVCLCRRKEPM